MDKLKNKKELIISIFIIMVTFFLMIIVWINKTTFSLDETTDNLAIVCDKTRVAPGDNLICQIEGYAKTNALTTISANYDFSDDVSYLSYGLDSECQDNCFNRITKANLENGFTIDSRSISSSSKCPDESTPIDGNLGYGCYDETIDTETQECNESYTYNAEENICYLAVTPSLSDTTINGSFSAGSIIVKIASNAPANSNLKIGLKDIKFIDSSSQEYSIENVETNVTVYSNDSTLSDLSIKDYAFNETFDSNKLVYTANVSSNVNSIDIMATKNDEFATIQGSIGSVDLHYGTNYLNVLVTSEDGTSTTKYKINVYRDYDFNTEKYVYNKDNNFIYTRNDTDYEVIKSNLEKLENNLSYSIQYGYLIIKYVEEVLEKIDIVNLKTNNFISDNKIYVKTGLTYQQLLDKIEVNNVNIEILNMDNQKVTSGTIQEGYKVNIYYSNNQEILLDTYTVSLEYLSFSDKLIVDTSSKIIKRIKAGLTYGDVISLIETNGEMSLSYNEQPVSSSDIVRTGSKIKINTGSSQLVYTISVLGDIDEDGKITVNDVALIYRHIKERETLDEVHIASADIYNKGSIDIGAVSGVYRYVKGRISDLEEG